MTWTPTPLYEFVAERADTRGDAQALVTTTARLNYRDQHAAVRRAAKACTPRGPARRFRRHSHGQQRDLGDAVLCCGNDRGRDRADQHSLQVGGTRLLPRAGRRKGAVHRRPLLEHRSPVVPSRRRAGHRSRASRRRTAAVAWRGRGRKRDTAGGAPLRCLPRARRQYQRPRRWAPARGQRLVQAHSRGPFSPASSSRPCQT